MDKVVVVDVDVDSEKFEDGSLKILRVLRPTWTADTVKFKTFTEGITNTLVGCYQKDDTNWADMVLVRIYGAMTDLIIDRRLEMINMMILHSAGCGGELYCRFNNGIAYEFMNGECLDEKTVRDPHIARLIAREMVTVQGIEPAPQYNITREPCLFPKLRDFLQKSPDSFPNPKKQERYEKDCQTKEQLKTELETMEKELTKLNSPIVFSHNDLLLKNIVHSAKEDRTKFIDYEYGAYNFEAFDIANHFCEYAGVDEVNYSLYPDKSYQLNWLRNFLKFKFERDGKPASAVTDLDIERLYVQVQKFALASHLYWGVWGLIQARYSTIDFDYLDYAILRLNEYLKRKKEFLSLKMPE